MSQISKQDVQTIVSIVGREGAISALSNSKRISSHGLMETADSLGLKVNSKDTKTQIATQIVRYVDKRITKSLGELENMSKEEILSYFEQVGCDEDEVVELLSSIDLRSRAKARHAILEFAAIQISSLGLFERVANRQS